MNSNIYYGIQCRMGSSRLPGKVLKLISGKELVLHLFENLVSNNVPAENIYFLIPNTSDNDILESFLKNKGLNYLKGSEKDVFSRYKNLCVLLGKGNVIARLTADNPFIDYRVIGSVLSKHIVKKAEFSSTREIKSDNSIIRYVPKGNSVDVFNTELLLNRDFNLTEFEEEHVIPVMYKLTPVNIVSSIDFDFEIQDSISVDTEDDFLRLKRSKNAS